MEDGTYPSNTWMEIDGNTYHMDENGYRFHRLVSGR